MAYERVTLYGVPLVADRLVAFGKIDPELARELFIRHALVYGEWRTHHRFLRDNREAARGGRGARAPRPAPRHRGRRAHALRLLRRAGSAAESSAVRTSTSGGSRRGGSGPTCSPSTCRCSPTTPPRRSRPSDFPAEWDGRRRLTFPISYHFEPGAADDGLTIDVPVATLNRVGGRRLLLERAGPARGAGHQPDPQPAQAAAGQLRAGARQGARVPGGRPPGEEPLLDALERWARSTTGVVVPREAWDWTKVPEHLRPTYRVVDEDGAEQAARQGPRGAQGAAAAAVRGGDRRGRGRQPGWPAPARRPGSSARSRSRSARCAPVTRCTVFPGLVDEGTTVGLRVFGSAEERGGAAPARRTPAAAAGRPPGARRSSTGSPTSRSSGWPARRTRPCAELLEDCRAAVVQEVVDARPAVRDAGGVRRRWPGRTPPTRRRALRAVLADVMRVLEAWRGREGAQRPGRHDDAARADRHEGPARPAGAPRVRRRGRTRPAAPLPDLPRRAQQRRPASTRRRAVNRDRT